MHSSFAYSAVNAAGARVRGRSDAESSAALQRTLEAQGLIVLQVRQHDAPAAQSWRRASRRQVLAATRAMSSLLTAGLSLPRALAAASNAAPGHVSNALRDVRTSVERGDTLAASLARYPACFDRLYVSIVLAGEQSADLPASFARLKSHLERETALRSRLVSASIYPLLLAVVGVAAVFALVFFVLPRFVGLLADAGAALPRSTQLLVGMATFAQRHFIALALLPALALAFGAWARNTDRGRRMVANACLHIPVIAGMRRRVLGARFARLLAVLLGGGAPLFRALGGVAGSMTDPLAREDVDRIRTSVREGRPLHAAVRESRMIPPIVAQLLQVGEEAGEVREFAARAADLLEEETERSLERVSALMEPAMIVVFGLIVGFVALSLLQAIYGVNAGSFR